MPGARRAEALRNVHSIPPRAFVKHGGTAVRLLRPAAGRCGSGKMRLFPWRICGECNLRAMLAVLFTRDTCFSWYNATDREEAYLERDKRVYESRT